jgi:hypothetical protein
VNVFELIRRGIARNVSIGVIDPMTTKELQLDPPLADGEQPVIASRHTPDLLLKEAFGSRVVIENISNEPVRYMLLILPSTVVRATMVDWSSPMADGGAALSGLASSLIERLKPKK